MSYFNNFKSVTYCVAQWADRVEEKQLRKEADWLQKYVGIDKVYLETYRGSFAKKEQLLMIKKVLKEYNIEVSGGITTVCPNLDEEDNKRQRLFETFCYSNEKMRNRLKEVSEYTASLFDEFIIDDFFFTQCMCEDCLKEKGSKSWKEFRLEKMMEVSKNLVIGPAKKVNPKCKIIIKYPNWRESYHETGYNPGQQREIFDGIYTGTETRHGAQQDQHLQRYLSYSLPRYMENVLPGKNGGGWFDPFECDRIDSYLEQAYLTAFSKSKELMMFCWPAIYNNKRATPLGYQYAKLDKIMGQCGNPVGLKVYVPFNSQGEDHIEDYLGMVGIPMEPTPDFPVYNPDDSIETNSVLVTASSLADKDILAKITDYTKAGGKVIATSGFVIGCKDKERLGELTSATYTNRSMQVDEFQVTVTGLYGRNYIHTDKVFTYPVIEHRNNATWSILNAGHGEYHESILMYDTYGKGRFVILNLPQMPSEIKELPANVLTSIRYELMGPANIWLDSESGLSLFTYDNETFGVYCYTADGCKPMDFNVHIKGKIWGLELVPDDDEVNPWKQKEIMPLYTKQLEWHSKEEETVFHLRIIPGDFQFFKIKK